MTRVIASSKGQIVIPQEIRARHKIAKGTRIEILDFGGVITLIPIQDDPCKLLLGMFKAKKTVLEILNESRQEDRRHEEKLASWRKNDA